MITLLIFIAVLAVLVLSHEFGHFIVARKNGIKVDEFGFGFPPRIFGIRRIVVEGGKPKWHIVWGNKNIQNEVQSAEHERGTVYSINWLPFGGFVKIKGEEGGLPNDPDSFLHKKIWQRVLVIIAGVAMNVLLAAALLSFAYMVGTPAVGGTEDGLQNVQVRIMEVLPGKPAEAAGLMAGDIIFSLNGQKNLGLPEVQNYINNHKNEEIAVTVKRGSELVIKNMHPVVDAATGKGGVGIAIATMGIVRYVWYKAIYYGFVTAGIYFWQILLAFGGLIKGLFTGAGVGSSVSGPVGIAKMTGEAAKLGFSYLMQFTALLSLNLAVLNILPIPALDGGRLLFIVLEKIMGKPVPIKYEHIIHSVFFMLLILLVLVITIKDLGFVWAAIGAMFKKV